MTDCCKRLPRRFAPRNDVKKGTHNDGKKETRNDGKKETRNDGKKGTLNDAKYWTYVVTQNVSPVVRILT